MRTIQAKKSTGILLFYSRTTVQYVATTLYLAAQATIAFFVGALGLVIEIVVNVWYG
jgi:hypothetical protein